MTAPLSDGAAETRDEHFEHIATGGVGFNRRMRRAARLGLWEQAAWLHVHHNDRWMDRFIARGVSL